MITPTETSDTRTRFDVPRREVSSIMQAEVNLNRKTATALSFAQERLWFLSRINPEDTSANIARAASVAGPLDREVLGPSLQSLVYRHEILRTTFATTELYAGIDSRPVQLVAPAGRFPLEFIDLSQTPEEEVDATTKRLVNERVRRQFDLSLGPLIRATLIRVAEQSHVLLITAHRIVVDDESLNILFRELWQVYGACADLLSAKLWSAPVQYGDFVDQQLRNLQSEAGARAIDYWRKSLAGAPPLLELPTDRPGSPLRTSPGASVSIDLDER